jgi:HAD superfamily hydrolase (TIGR01450 family)
MITEHPEVERRTAAFLLDMDGVLFHGDQALPGAVEFLEAIASSPHCFVTNNPIRTPESVAAHFANLGLPLPTVKSIVTSAEATAAWLASELPGYRYFAVGDRGLDAALSRHGVADAKAADFVVVGEGVGLDYDSLTTGINLIIDHGARLICTNPDESVDAVVDGTRRVLPGAGALVAPFVAATHVQPVYIGKPYPLLYEMAMSRLSVTAQDCIMIGDRPDTDIAGAQSLGMRTALVRTGRFGAAASLPHGIKPDWDVGDLFDLIRTLHELGIIMSPASDLENR